jgi:hypothetical protein
VSKLIIQNDSTHNDAQALQYVMTVIRNGRISEDGKSYCYVTSFVDGVVVGCMRNAQSDRFVVRDGAGGEV